MFFWNAIGLGTSVPEKMELKYQELAWCENGSLHLQESQFRAVCQDLKRKHKDSDIAVITVVGPPQSGKSALLREAIEELVIETKSASEVIFLPATEDDSKMRHENRLLITTPCVLARSTSTNTSLAVFGLDIDVNEYNFDIYNKLIEFALTLSSIVIVSVPAHYDSSFWDGTKCFKAFFGEDRLQKVGFAMFQENASRVPYGVMELPDFLTLKTFDDTKLNLVRQVVKSFKLPAALSFLPETNTKQRGFDKPEAYHFRFFSNLFQHLEAVQRRGMVLSAKNAQQIVWSFYDNLNGNTSPTSSAPPTEASSYFPNPNQSPTQPTASPEKSHQDTSPWNVKYDLYFKEQRPNCVYLLPSDIDRIHKEVSEKVKRDLKASRQKVPNLAKFLNHKLKEQLDRETSIYNAFTPVERQLNSAILQCEYELAVQALHPLTSIGYPESKTGMERILQPQINNSPMDFQPYCLQTCRAYQTDFLSTIQLIGYYRDNMKSSLDLSVCVPPETLSQQHSRIQAQVFDQIHYIYEPTKERLRHLLEASMKNSYTWFCETNKTRSALETHLALSAIERILAKYVSAMSRFLSNQILPNHQIQHIHQQLYQAAINSFLFKNTAPSRRFKISPIWESTLPKLEAGLLQEYNHFCTQNTTKLNNYLKRRKQVIQICRDKYNTCIVTDCQSETQARHAALQYCQTMLSNKENHVSRELLETLEKALHTFHHPRSSSSSQEESTLSSEMDYEESSIVLPPSQQHNSSFASTDSTDQEHSYSNDHLMDDGENPGSTQCATVTVDYKQNLLHTIQQLESKGGNSMDKLLKQKIDEIKTALKRSRATQDQFQKLERSLQVAIKVSQQK